MIVEDLIHSGKFTVLNDIGNKKKTITVPFCCDLLSIAMSKSPAGAAWITVMGNVNTIAVATLTDVSAVIIAEDMTLDAFALDKAKEQGVIVLATPLPIFEAANWIYTQIIQ